MKFVDISAKVVMKIGKKRTLGEIDSKEEKESEGRDSAQLKRKKD